MLRIVRFESDRGQSGALSLPLGTGRLVVGVFERRFTSINRLVGALGGSALPSTARAMLR